VFAGHRQREGVSTIAKKRMPAISIQIGHVQKNLSDGMKTVGGFAQFPIRPKFVVGSEVSSVVRDQILRAQTGWYLKGGNRMFFPGEGMT
jgi:hypothetical protein